jgi:formamidopyrimidine-DNA glycosylase
LFRGTDTKAIERDLPGKKLIGSESRGKQMLFQFSGNLWVGIHLGMTGNLSIGDPNYAPEKHDHFVLFQKKRALVFNDMRQFGRVLFHKGKEGPAWWQSIAAGVTSPEFTLDYMRTFLERHARLPIKASLLLQKGFPGVGNWMADEILWRAKIAPARKSNSLSSPEGKKLWTQARFVCHKALENIGGGDDEPPAGWLFHQRWSAKGVCPRHKTPLTRETIGARTTAWCPKCQS